MEQLPFDALAYEIAQRLNDPDALPLYKTYVEKYTSQFLRDTLQKVMSIPNHKIRRTRGALFTFLVTHNGAGHLRD
jgi:thiaminase